LPATPTGDNTIGRVKLTDGTDVADILDLSNSNPLTVAIVDGSGDQITSFGGGTQYTEDAAAAANPVGTAVNLIRQDTPAALVTTDGDNVAQRGTNYGAGFVQVLTSAGAFVDTFGGGQQYSDGDAEADPTGTVAMGTDGANIFAVHTDTSGDLQVDVLSSALPTGASTAANQTTGNTSLATIAGAVSGTEMQVDVLTIAAGDNNIGNVDVVSSALPTGASTLAEQQTQTTALQLIDDTVKTLGTDTYSEATTKGLAVGAVRRDADTSAVNTDNEVAPLLVNAIGALKVEVFSGETLPISATDLDIRNLVAATDIVDLGGNALTSLQLIDDVVFTDDTSTHSTGSTKGIGIMAAATPTDTAVGANDIGMLAMTVNRELLVQVNTALPAGTNAIGKLSANSGVDIGDVDVTTVGTITPGTAATNLGKAEDVGHTTGDVGVFSLSVANEAQTTLAADNDYIARAADVKGNSMIVGNIANDGTDAGNPVKVGGQARQTNPTAVADADRVNFIADDLGRQVVVTGQVRDLMTDQTTTISASTSETTILTQVASTFLDVTALWVANTSATATRIDIRDTTAGSVRFSIYVPAGDTRGAVMTRPIKQTTVNTNWTAQSSTSVTDLRIFIQAEKNI